MKVTVVVNESNCSIALGSTHDEDQKYWIDIIIHGFRDKNLLEKTIENRKIEIENRFWKLNPKYPFIKAKRFNAEVWLTQGGRFHSQDCKLQEQETQSSLSFTLSAGCFRTYETLIVFKTELIGCNGCKSPMDSVKKMLYLLLEILTKLSTI